MYSRRGNALASTFMPNADENPPHAVPLVSRIFTRKTAENYLENAVR
jgi:hypothetical protein